MFLFFLYDDIINLDSRCFCEENYYFNNNSIINLFEINFKYKIDMDVEILSNGSVNVTEVWDVQLIGDRDWCKSVDALDLGLL